ncbi:MAG: amidohydrolase, partial [Firmicutes bacterium]|nr:amidohydrolase [Bacillota bacterium]
TRFNVIPQEVVVEGTVRTCREEDQERMIDNLHQAFAAGASLHGGEYVLEYQKGVPAVINDSAVVDELGSAFATKISETPVIQEGLASLIGEDVAYYLQMVPGALLLVGSGQEGFIPELHHPGFLVPNKTLETGYKALTSIMEMYLS